MKEDSRILVTGGTGFIGRFLCEEFKKRSYRNILALGKKDYNLTREREVEKLFEENGGLEVVIHLAGVSGGVGYIKENPGKVFYENIMMNSLMLEHSRINGVKKFVGVGSAYCYPKNSVAPFKEEDIWNGEVEQSGLAYSLAKKMMLVQSQAYRKQYGFNAIYLLLSSVYGPSSTPYVVSSLIKEFCQAVSANKNVANVWGSGEVSRDFLYAEDAAEAIFKATKEYNGAEPINIGSGKETRIFDLAKMIAAEIGFNGEIVLDKSKPDGPKRIILDCAKAEREFGFKAKTLLRDGLIKTIKHYEENKSKSC